jgi:TPR repeat protein
MRNVPRESQSGVELNGDERSFTGIARAGSVRRLAGLFLGLALMVGSATAAMAGSGDVQEAGQVADLGYADVIAPLRAAAKNDDVRAQETLGFMYLCIESRCVPGIQRDPDEARYWLDRAARKGSMVAAYTLAWLQGKSRPELAIAAQQE